MVLTGIESIRSLQCGNFFWSSRRLDVKQRRVQVLVRDNNVDQALKVLKKKMQREGVFREMKLYGHYEKPSERKNWEKAEAIRRARKLARKKLRREGLLPMKPRVIRGPPEGAAPRAFLASDPGTPVQQAKSLRR